MFAISIVKPTWSSETLTSEESGSTANSCANDYQKYDILSEIFNAEPDNTTYNPYSWKVKGEMRLQDKVVQLVKTSWFDVISKYIHNRGYRIIIALPNHQTKILAQEKSDTEGKRRIQDRWKIIQALQETHIVLRHPSCIQESGYFQAETMVLETNEIPAHDLAHGLCHFQNMYYGTLTPLDILHPTSAPTYKNIQTGIAQCTVPPAQLKVICNNLSGKKFPLKLWPSSSALQITNISVNYHNKMEQHKFEEILEESLFSPSHTFQSMESEILLYMPCSSKSFDENMIQASQLAFDLGFSGKVAVFEWCTKKQTASIEPKVEEVKPQLIQFLKILCSHSAKVHIIAVYDAALLLVKSLTKCDCKLGQVILTKLHWLSYDIFFGLQSMAQNVHSQVENITIYYKPKPLYKSLSLTNSFTLGRDCDIFSQKCPPPFIPNVDIICLESNHQIPNCDYAVNKAVTEDMSEIICFGKSIAERSSRVKLQCACQELKRPIFRSNLPCTICSCCSNFVMEHVSGLSNCTPAVLEEMEQSLHEEYNVEDKIEKHSRIHKQMQFEGMLSRQYNNNSKFFTKSAPK